MKVPLVLVGLSTTQHHPVVQKGKKEGREEREGGKEDDEGSVPYLECWQISVPHWPGTTSAQIVTQEKVKSASQKCHEKVLRGGGIQDVCQDRTGGFEQRPGDWDPGSLQRSGTELSTQSREQCYLEASRDDVGLGCL